jgi:hypothetical protein
MKSGVTETEDFYETITQIQKVLFSLFNGYANFLFMGMFKRNRQK